MARIADAPLIKVTLNLYEEDVYYLQSKIGYGYTEHIRQIVKERVAKMKYDRGDDVYEGGADEYD